MRDDHVMLRIDRRLHVVADHAGAAAAGGHRARVGVGQGDLAVGGLRHLLADLLELAHLLLDRLDLLLKVLDPSFRHQCRFPVRPIQFGHVACGCSHRVVASAP